MKKDVLDLIFHVMLLNSLSDLLSFIFKVHILERLSTHLNKPFGPLSKITLVPNSADV